MRFVCHRQDCAGVRLTDRECSLCKLQFTVGGLSRHFKGSILGFLKNRLAIRCPNPKCGGLIPAFQSTCPDCKNTLTVGEVLEKTVGQGKSKSGMKLVQRIYVLISAIVFWVSFGVFEHHYADSWIQHALLSIVYLAVFMLVSLWVIPPKTIYFLARQASRLVRLGLVFNFLTGLFFLQMYLTAWWARSLMLAGLFAVTWFAAWLFWAWLWPMSLAIQGIFMPTNKPFNPADAQGRDVRMD